jgi:hypothetical protein
VSNITLRSSPARKKIIETQKVAKEVRNQYHEPLNPKDGISNMITQADLGLLASSSPLRESHTTNKLIDKTKQTLVFKTTYKGIAIAIKVYKKPRVKEFADMWKNEFKILKRLNYISKIIKYTSLLNLYFNKHLLLNLWIITLETYTSS